MSDDEKLKKQMTLRAKQTNQQKPETNCCDCCNWIELKKEKEPNEGKEEATITITVPDGKCKEGLTWEPDCPGFPKD